MHKLLSAYNEYPDITREFTGPKHFVITRVDCMFNWNLILDITENIGVALLRFVGEIQVHFACQQNLVLGVLNCYFRPSN